MGVWFAWFEVKNPKPDDQGRLGSFRRDGVMHTILVTYNRRAAGRQAAREGGGPSPGLLP